MVPEPLQVHPPTREIADCSLCVGGSGQGEEGDLVCYCTPMCPTVPYCAALCCAVRCCATSYPHIRLGRSPIRFQVPGSRFQAGVVFRHRDERHRPADRQAACRHPQYVQCGPKPHALAVGFCPTGNGC